MLAISLATSTAIFARVDGGFNNVGNHDLNNGFHNYNYNDGYRNNFYYDRNFNDNNGLVIVPDDNLDSSCQTTQTCDEYGNCVTQQNCN